MRTFQSFLITEDAKKAAHNIASSIKAVKPGTITRGLRELGLKKGDDIQDAIDTLQKTQQFGNFKAAVAQAQQKRNEETINEGAWSVVKWIGKKFIWGSIKWLVNNVIMPVFGSFFKADTILDKIELAGYLYLIYLLPIVIGMDPTVTWTVLINSPFFFGTVMAWIITVIAHKITKLSGANPDVAMA